MREHEVPGGDRHPVAPAGLRPYAVDDREGLPPDDPCVRDEVRPQGRVGLDLEGAREDLLHQDRQHPATFEEHVEARRLALRSRPDDERASALRRLLGRAARRCNDEYANDQSRCEHERQASHDDSSTSLTARLIVIFRT